MAGVGKIFAVFDRRTQDSGNESYGVEVGGWRHFVKTAGDPDDVDSARLSHAERVGLLRNAAELARSVRHPALPKFHGVVESPRAPMLVYEWADGHLVRSALARVRALPASEIARLLDAVFDLHAALAERGWVACDFYDGAMIYDFQRRRVHAVDLDCYRRGAFVNEMGRMFGSSRFMSPEEFERGATIDERTTIFTLGRTAAVLLSDGSPPRALQRVGRTARSDADGMPPIAGRAFSDCGGVSRGLGDGARLAAPALTAILEFNARAQRREEMGGMGGWAAAIL